MYSRNVFLSTPLFSGDVKVFKIISDGGGESFIINVCKYQKSLVRDNKIIIISDNFHEPKVLEFKSKSEAALAHRDLVDRITFLRKNCENDSGSVTPSPGTGGLNAVVEDTTPELGGDLDAAGNKIINLPNPTTNDEATNLGTLLEREKEFVACLIPFDEEYPLHNTGSGDFFQENVISFPYKIKINKILAYTFIGANPTGSDIELEITNYDQNETETFLIEKDSEYGTKVFSPSLELNAYERLIFACTQNDSAENAKGLWVNFSYNKVI